MALIHELTDGVPRRINVFCDRILLFGYLEEVRFFTKEHIKQVSDELADEITSPINVKKHEEIDSYMSKLQKTYANKTDSIEGAVEEYSSIIIDETEEPYLIQQANLQEDVNSDFVDTEFIDIEETIKDFEHRVEQEIQAYKSSLEK
jgi:hypothetical protein